jgi:tetratricopeptide (TPR) repeat protein
MTHESLLEQAEQHRQTAYNAFERGNFATARPLYQQALALYDQAWAQRSDQMLRMRIFYALRNLGLCALHQEDFAVARDAYERIFTDYQRWGAQLQEEELHLSILKAYIGLHDYDAAVAAIHRAREFARLHEARRQAAFLWQLIDIAIEIQRNEVVSDLFAQAYAASERIPRGLEYASKLLWAWGQFEYNHHSSDVGHALLRLAVVTAMQHLDVWHANVSRVIRPGYSSSTEAYDKTVDALKQQLRDFDHDAQKADE